MPENVFCRNRILHCNGEKINFCIHCDYCIKNKNGCVHKDDMQFVYEKLYGRMPLLSALLSTKGMLSAQTKAIMDRCRAIAAQDLHFIRNKPGAALAVGGDRIGGQEPSIQAVHNFYIINEAIPVGGGSFGQTLAELSGQRTWCEGRKRR